VLVGRSRRPATCSTSTSATPFFALMPPHLCAELQTALRQPVLTCATTAKTAPSFIPSLAWKPAWSGRLSVVPGLPQEQWFAQPSAPQCWRLDRRLCRLPTQGGGSGRLELGCCCSHRCGNAVPASLDLAGDHAHLSLLPISCATASGFPGLNGAGLPDRPAHGGQAPASAAIRPGTDLLGVLPTSRQGTRPRLP